jgi:hypothetical protein
MNHLSCMWRRHCLLFFLKKKKNGRRIKVLCVVCWTLFPFSLPQSSFNLGPCEPFFFFFFWGGALFNKGFLFLC